MLSRRSNWTKPIHCRSWPIIGFRSAQNLTTGDYNTIIGNEGAQSTADAQNQIVIGSLLLEKEIIRQLLETRP